MEIYWKDYFIVGLHRRKPSPSEERGGGVPGEGRKEAVLGGWSGSSTTKEGRIPNRPRPRFGGTAVKPGQRGLRSLSFSPGGAPALGHPVDSTQSNGRS